VTADEHAKPVLHVFVLFGATGDLAKRRLFPGLYHLAAADRLPDEYAVIGSGRHPSRSTTGAVPMPAYAASEIRSGGVQLAQRGAVVLASA
jgi:glucose-6-phosphate 1-dehydrogenase